MTKEKVLLIAVKLPHQTKEHFQSSLNELHSLCETAGGKVIKMVTQNRDRIDPATYIGTGKVYEIQEIIEEHSIDLIISNDELTASQLRNLNHKFRIRIIDRSQLILDIFAKRAFTKEGQLQVELAQLQYTLPRLRGIGTELSRLGGGIGTRGPGETQLETDQRYIRRRIDDISRQLQAIVRQREQYRKRRRRNYTFQIAIVGYTNAGKSTLFNQLTKSNTLEEDQLFATLDPLTRTFKFPSGFTTIMTDTVGFIQDLPTSLIAAFRSTLEEVTGADFILHVVDGSNENYIQHEKTVEEHLEALSAHHIPTLTVYNKKDLFKEELIPRSHPWIQISAYEEKDIIRLVSKMEKLISNDWQRYRIALDPSDGKTLVELERETILIQNYFHEQLKKYMIEGYMRKNHPLNRFLKEKE